MGDVGQKTETLEETMGGSPNSGEWKQRCIGMVLAARWEIIAVIAEGGMGAVFAAQDCITDQLVAIKLVSPELRRDEYYVDRFLQEARIASTLHHRNIVPTYAWGIDSEHGGYLVMEHLIGETLGERLSREGCLSLSEIRSVALETLAALEVAHAHGVIHRDLKPQNIFLALDDEGAERVNILDFGVAKLAQSRAAITRTGLCVGTARFMPPEQARANARVDHRADLYSVGMLIYSCLAGKVPYAEVPVAEVLWALSQRAPVPLEFFREDLPEEVYGLVERATARDPRERFLSAREMASAIRKQWPETEPQPRAYYFNSQIISTEPGTRTTSSSPQKGRN